ncbi:hypothetical protein ABTX99_20380 [Streptomyces flaveolus]|uniref:hypothetical protein n=1 Tax=Streptomyces flaveolus TaxID=67297 RepID=UPI00332E9C3E
MWTCRPRPRSPTAFDAADGINCHTGADADGAVTVDTVRYWPRLCQGKRMIGGAFQASNSRGGPRTDLHTISCMHGDGTAAHR